MPFADQRRQIPIHAYLWFAALFSAIVCLSHGPLLRLPYFWDEAGQFVPAALDILRQGSWVPRSASPNIHPPAVMAYLAGVWKVAGYEPLATRGAMLLIGASGLLVAFLLAIELCREAPSRPALLVPILLAVSPLYFAQSMLAQLDAPATVFTALALLLFLQDRLKLSAATCVVLVLVKETGLLVPAVFCVWLLREKRWRDAAWFLAPALPLAGWVVVLMRQTGHWAGNAEFVRYNLEYPLEPVRLGVALLRRLYYLFAADFHWIGTAAILYTWKRSSVFRSRHWRVAWLLVLAHVALVTVLGGAVLDRYLLPIVPVVYTAMAVGLASFNPAPRVLCAAALVVGVAAGNWINPPYPFPYEDNLAFSDFVMLQKESADFVARSFQNAQVETAWPLTIELARPELGFVPRAMAVHSLPDFTLPTLEGRDWGKADVVVIFLRTWDTPVNLMRIPAVQGFWQRFCGYAPSATREEVERFVPLRLTARFERRGQWLDVYANPRLLPQTNAAPVHASAKSRRGGEGHVE